MASNKINHNRLQIQLECKYWFIGTSLETASYHEIDMAGIVPIHTSNIQNHEPYHGKYDTQ